jgi:hypothetical protein
MNVHKRCQKNVANNCGINPKQIALLLEELGISDNVPAKPKVILSSRIKALTIHYRLLSEKASQSFVDSKINEKYSAHEKTFDGMLF